MSPPDRRLLTTDDSGYTLSAADLTFLAISDLDVAHCVDESLPLAMPSKHFEEFSRSLLQAIWLEGIREVDVRLQGSSVNFYSGRHKSMPNTATEAAEIFVRENGESPNHTQLMDIWNAVTAQWPDKSRPRRRPFDALFKLGISAEPSDYDVQIASDELFQKIADRLGFAGIDAHGLDVENSNYGFMRKEFADQDFLYLADWIARWEPVLDRPINIAIFRSSGPPKRTNDRPGAPKPMSSHFKRSDWIVHRGKIVKAELFPTLVGAGSDVSGSAVES
jgi:hypothetical protein